VIKTMQEGIDKHLAHAEVGAMLWTAHVPACAWSPVCNGAQRASVPTMCGFPPPPRHHAPTAPIAVQPMRYIMNCLKTLAELDRKWRAPCAPSRGALEAWRSHCKSPPRTPWCPTVPTPPPPPPPSHPRCRFEQLSISTSNCSFV
jgi:hypothetical protein